MILDIVRKLWSSVYDLLAYEKGDRSKTIEQIEEDLDAIEYLCRPYADADDSDICLRKEEVNTDAHGHGPCNVRSTCGCVRCSLCCNKGRGE